MIPNEYKYNVGYGGGSKRGEVKGDRNCESTDALSMIE
jgi:hypothetical protein